jgi:nucleoside-diphosphate-sugar epimerase
MKILVTGAAGRLGVETVAQLHAAGCEVIATDIASRRPLPVPLRGLNLLDTPVVAAMMGGVEAVVHLGNHIHVRKGKREAETFNENVAMNMNVFHAALDAGVKRIIFASSVQVMASESGGESPYPPHARRVAYLPMDCHSPENPCNSYALSKSVGETMLKQYTVPHGLTCVALRFPQIADAERFERYRLPPLERDWHPSRITQAFSFISQADAARAILACLTADLAGYHVFFPAISQIHGLLVPQAIARYYPNVPLKRPIDRIDSLVDHSHFTDATGWRPRDIL